MLQSTELEIKLSETRTELRALQADPPADDATEEVRSAFDTKIDDGMKSLDDLETQKRTALKAEEVAQERALKLVNVEQRVGGGDIPNMPPEFREFMGIEARCSLDGFFDGIHDNIETAGAEREMRSALGVNERGVIPWPMLIEPKRLQEIRQEQRAALAEGAKVRAIIGKEFADKIGEGNDIFLRAAFGSGSTVMSMQDPVIQDVFGASTAAFLMTRFSSAPVGDALELVLTSSGAGITADRTARAAAGSLTARTLSPKAVRAVYDINKTDLQRFRGLESSLRADLPRAINDVIDANVLNGTGFSGSILARTTDPTNPSVDVTFGSGIASLAAAIDGKHARTLKEVKLVVNPHTLAYHVLVAGEQHGGHAPGLLHGEFGRRHDHEQHACHEFAHQQGHRVQDRPGRAVQRHRQDVGRRHPGREGRVQRSPEEPAHRHGERVRRLRCGQAGWLPPDRVPHGRSVAMAKSTAALTKLLAGLDDPDSQDPKGFGREDVAVQLQTIGCRTSQ